LGLSRLVHSRQSRSDLTEQLGKHTGTSQFGHTVKNKHKPMAAGRQVWVMLIFQLSVGVLKWQFIPGLGVLDYIYLPASISLQYTVL